MDSHVAIHTFHTGCAGGGHVSHTIKAISRPKVLPSSTNPALTHGTDGFRNALVHAFTEPGVLPVIGVAGAAAF